MGKDDPYRGMTGAGMPMPSSWKDKSGGYRRNGGGILRKTFEIHMIGGLCIQERA